MHSLLIVSRSCDTNTLETRRHAYTRCRESLPKRPGLPRGWRRIGSCDPVSIGNPDRAAARRCEPSDALPLLLRPKPRAGARREYGGDPSLRDRGTPGLLQPGSAAQPRPSLLDGGKDDARPRRVRARTGSGAEPRRPPVRAHPLGAAPAASPLGSPSRAPTEPMARQDSREPEAGSRKTGGPVALGPDDLTSPQPPSPLRGSRPRPKPTAPGRPAKTGRLF